MFLCCMFVPFYFSYIVVGYRTGKANADVILYAEIM